MDDEAFQGAASLIPITTPSFDEEDDELKMTGREMGQDREEMGDGEEDLPRRRVASTKVSFLRKKKNLCKLRYWTQLTNNTYYDPSFFKGPTTNHGEDESLRRRIIEKEEAEAAAAEAAAAAPVNIPS